MDAGRLVGSLAIAAVAAAGPLWLLGVRGQPCQPLAAPADRPCLQAKDSMRRNHPALLATWRELALRTGRRADANAQGGDVPIQLSTCLGCHGPASQFCDRCHAEVGVSPTCWQCHPRFLTTSPP